MISNILPHVRRLMIDASARDVRWKLLKRNEVKEMKDSYFVKIHKTPEGLPFAVSMRADYKAEHEGGINPLMRVLTSNDGIGLDSNRIAAERVGPGKDAFQLKEGHVYGWKAGRKSKLRALLLVGDLSDLNPEYTPEIADRDKPLNGTWDSKNFILSARDDESKALLKEVEAEASRRNVLIFQGFNPVNPSDGGCLILLIEDRTPVEYLDMITELNKRKAA
jgi:hypothetical protein